MSPPIGRNHYVQLLHTHYNAYVTAIRPGSYQDESAAFGMSAGESCVMVLHDREHVSFANTSPRHILARVIGQYWSPLAVHQ